jgi:hypothetical protein
MGRTEGGQSRRWAEQKVDRAEGGQSRRWTEQKVDKAVKEIRLKGRHKGEISG